MVAVVEYTQSCLAWFCADRFSCLLFDSDHRTHHRKQKEVTHVYIVSVDNESAETGTHQTPCTLCVLNVALPSTMRNARYNCCAPTFFINCKKYSVSNTSHLRSFIYVVAIFTIFRQQTRDTLPNNANKMVSISMTTRLYCCFIQKW
jgi:hypothetical protein